MDIFAALKQKLIVSCQALEHEPLHSSYIMGKMALAAVEGGAAGIRANSRKDIEEIKKNVQVPVVGIVKRDYPDSPVYITPTMDEVDELVKAKADIIALDATAGLRPDNLCIRDFFSQIKQKYPEQLLMADCSTTEEMLVADALGFDFVGTTMVGYTEHSRHLRIEDNDFEILRWAASKLKARVIAEGNIDTPEKARRAIELGCFSVVVGGAITRPQLITKKFVDRMQM